LVDSLSGASTIPKPSFPALLDTLRFYSPPDPSEARDIHQLWLSVRNRVRATSDSLYSIQDRDSPGYRDLYARFRNRYDDLLRREATLERALRAVSASHAALARRATDAADSVRAWEQVALQPFDSLVAVREAQTARTAQTGSFRVDHSTVLSVPAGDWWLTARQPHPDNPFFEYRWAVAFRVAAGLPVSVPIRDRDITLQWRH
jgi:hypothetical protein